MSYTLAIDIGASSGRHLIGKVENGVLVYEEVFRFENGMTELDGHLTWNIEALFENIVLGIRKCFEIGKIPKTVAIDTWGVDYVLLDSCGKEILPAIAYRDGRTEGLIEKVAEIIPHEELYAKTGIQTQSYNTIYQLYWDKKNGRLDKAKRLLMMPEYLAYRLTDVAKHEYTICSTSGLLNAKTKEWDKDIISRLGISCELFGKVYPPKTLVGSFTDEVRERVGFDAEVVFAPSHDTASAIAACPTDESSVFISSGTWSLVGTENLTPILTQGAREANFANEGGIDFRFRFLKNIMGMWLFQSIRRELNKKYSYNEMMKMAMESSFKETFDPQDPAFLAPSSMIEAIRTYLGKKDLPLGDVLSSVYHSLAMAYKRTVLEIERVADKKITTVAIVGGGSRDEYLNRLTREYTGKRVTAGPVECTAFGNLLAQLSYLDESLTLDRTREIVRGTFKNEIKEYN